MGKKRGNNEGSIYQRGDTGVWVGAVTIYDEGGKAKRKTVTGKTRAEVSKKLTALQHAKERGLAITGERQTLRQFLTSWIDETVKTSTRPRTYESYKTTVRNTSFRN